jgi:hypothetical protein
LHGLAYVFFIIIGQVFTSAVWPASVLSSMQAVIFAATTGVGLFFGTQFAGIVMDSSKVGDKFVWSKIWIVPAVITLIGVIVLAALFHDPAPAGNQAAAAAAVSMLHD